MRMKFLDWTKIFYALSILAAVEGCARTDPGEGELTTLGPELTTTPATGSTTTPATGSTTTSTTGSTTTGSTTTTASTSTSSSSTSSTTTMSTTTVTPDCEAAYGQFGIGWTYWPGDANSEPGCFGVAVSADALTTASVQGIIDFCTNSGATGATPASFHSQAQYDFLTTTTRLGSATPAWLNLYYDMTTGVLMWIDGSTVDFIRAPLTNTDPTTTMLGWFFDDAWLAEDPADGTMNNVWCRAPVP